MEARSKEAKGRINKRKNADWKEKKAQSIR